MKNNLQKMIDEKYISVQKHTEADLYIYNYTQKAQFDKVWNEETLSCRGLIMDGNGNVVARPFRKFFNLEEQKELPAEEFEVFEKWDGSLGITYWLNNKPYIATRGSFTSEQSVVASKMIQKLYLLHPYSFLREYTYLFEIIYPENRIVVDYKGMRGLVLLSIIETQTGKEVPYIELQELKGIFNVVKRYDGLNDISKIREIVSGENKEGFVIRFKNGLRIKIKYEEYVRLHRLITGVNARRIWDLLRNNQSLDELLQHVPEEFYKWVKITALNIKNSFDYYNEVAGQAYLDIKDIQSRKEQAQIILKKYKEYSGLVFSLLDKKDISDSIWKMIKPKHELPFKTEI